MRDFIGTGWYSSEYIVGTKTFNNFELSAGLGFGRLAGENLLKNPMSFLISDFKTRKSNSVRTGGSIGKINWFTGAASPFGAISYQLGQKIQISGEYSPDLMKREQAYLDVKSPWNFGIRYILNEYVGVSAQYLHGSTASITTNLITNPKRPPFNGGLELAPVPMRSRSVTSLVIKETDISKIRTVLNYDKFEILFLEEDNDRIRIDVINRKFRSTAQAIGRISSTLQRFTSDKIKTAEIAFHRNNLQVASYEIDLESVTKEQFNAFQTKHNSTSILARDIQSFYPYKKENRAFSWALGPYITHRLFNPDLPLSAETGAELKLQYRLSPKLQISSSFRKSILTNLTKNKRISGSLLPAVQTKWPLYDFAGQDGHINNLKLSFYDNLGPGLYGRLHAGFLEPFFAGVGGEILYKPANSLLGLGFDIHYVRQRDYNMLFDFLDYRTTVGHLSIYYQANDLFDIELNIGRFLAGDWGATTTISRVFGNGWEVGGYATLTDVPFETFGEGSFDKGIYTTIPVDWIIGSPDQSKRRFVIRPITRDGGARLASSKILYKKIRNFQNGQFKRELGRLWK